MGKKKRKYTKRSAYWDKKQPKRPRTKSMAKGGQHVVNEQEYALSRMRLNLNTEAYAMESKIRSAAWDILVAESADRRLEKIKDCYWKTGYREGLLHAMDIIRETSEALKKERG